jgi:hypothetical protein
MFTGIQYLCWHIYVMCCFVLQVISTMMAGIEEITGVRGDFYIRVGSISLSSEHLCYSLWWAKHPHHDLYPRPFLNSLTLSLLLTSFSPMSGLADRKPPNIPVIQHYFILYQSFWARISYSMNLLPAGWKTGTLNLLSEGFQHCNFLVWVQCLKLSVINFTNLQSHYDHILNFISFLFIFFNITSISLYFYIFSLYSLWHHFS